MCARGLLAGEDPQGGGVSNRLAAGVGIEFPVDVFDVGFDGFWRDEQLVGNFSLVQLLGQQVQDRTLPCGQGLHHRLGTRRGRGVALRGGCCRCSARRVRLESSQELAHIAPGTVLLAQPLQQVGHTGPQVPEHAYETARLRQAQRLGQGCARRRLVVPGIMEQGLQRQDVDQETGGVGDGDKVVQLRQ